MNLEKVEILEHRINIEGVQPTEEKVGFIKKPSKQTILIYFRTYLW